MRAVDELLGVVTRGDLGGGGTTLLGTWAYLFAGVMMGLRVEVDGAGRGKADCRGAAEGLLTGGDT